MKVALFDHPTFSQHEPPDGHPERRERLDAVRRAVKPYRNRIVHCQAQPVSASVLEDIHPSLHVSQLKQACETAASEQATSDDLACLWSAEPVDIRKSPPRSVIDADTYVSPHSFSAATHACGAAAAAARGVLDGSFQRAFCAVRPPGHHATSTQAMGFCLFNNVAVAAQQAIRLGAPRVAILDWDVHHGNGTQDIFWNRPDVFYASLHQAPLYPGTGAASERGAGDGLGTTLNCPLPAGADDSAFVRQWDEVIAPALEQFAPTLLCISAGFDADRRESLSGLDVSAAGLAELSRKVVRWSHAHCEGRIVSILEGGYNTTALEENVGAHVGHLLND